jgi:UDP-N-acetyl-2-amino-2-deoxyglucuronate dehydrogenase
MEEVRFGVVGMGMGRSRARTVSQTAGAKLQMVCDLREDRVRPVGEELGCEWTTSLEAVLGRDDVDVVMVMLPSGLHGDVAIQVMRSGKHAITTKPMEVTLAKADAMIACAQETGRILAVDFESRYERSWQQMKAAIDGGLFGKMVLGEARLKWWRAQSYYSDSGWRGTWAMDGGGSLANQTVHFIDLLVWLMGDVAEVLAGYYGAHTHAIETEDLGMGMLRFTSGAMGAVLGTTTFPKSPYAGLEVHGEQGGAILTFQGEPSWYFLEEGQQPPEVTPRVRNVIEDVASAVRDGTPVAVDGREGRRSLELLTGIYTAARERRPVPMGELR